MQQGHGTGNFSPRSGWKNVEKRRWVTDWKVREVRKSVRDRVG